ncbi:MAG: hypothetical protein J0L61_12005 [Planctomycetes bacterium]|nr:hypothetical protein [Planctomycetota bacterium]
MAMSLRLMTLLVLTLTLVAVGSRSAVGAPEPEAIPRRWEVRVEPGPLRCMNVEVPGKGAQSFFYMTFKATNLSGQDLYFAPSFDLALSDGTVSRSGRDVPAEATRAILEYVNNPFLKEEIALQGQFLQGPENAKEGLVVWPARTLKLSEASVYMAGFSGETKSIVRPDTGKAHVLRKTLMLRHEVNGEIDPSLNTTLTRSVQRWILR